MEKQDLREYTKITIETEKENPIVIAEITADEVQVANGYRVRLTPKYN